MILVYIVVATVLVMGVLSIFSSHHRGVSLMLLHLVRLLVLLAPYLVLMTAAMLLAYLTKWTFALSELLYKLAGANKQVKT